MKIVGVMRLCNEFVDEVELTIGSLSAFCDGVCFVMDEVTDFTVLRAVANCRHVLGTENHIRSDGKWNHWSSCDQAYHLANRFSPDWILMPDQDELLPYPQLPQMLAEFDDQDIEVAYIPPIHCFGSPYRIVHPALNMTEPHCRIFRGGIASFTTVGGPGCCCPRNMGRYCYTAYPMRHMSFMTQRCRETRLQIQYRRTRVPPWQVPSRGSLPLLPFRPDWTVDQWHGIQLNELFESLA